MSELAIKGGKPVRTASWPGWPVHDEREEKAVLDVLRTGKWGYNDGEKVKEFEKKFADYQDARFGVATVNGTMALHTAMVCAGVGPGDEVIVPPYTFIATANSVVLSRAKPVFCDIELETANIDPDEIEKHITERTRAIMPVHFFGLVCDMDRINDIAERHNLLIIEDACHTWGAKWKGKGTGALGDAGALSFQSSKNITAGEGGIILTDNEELARLCHSYVNCGREKGEQWYYHARIGPNLRMTEIQAALLLVQLERLGEHNARRAANAEYLDEKLGAIPGIRVAPHDERAEGRVYHGYLVRYDQEAFGGLPRKSFLEAASQEGAPFGGGYLHPVHKAPAYRDCAGPDGKKLRPCGGEEWDFSDVSCPNSELLCERALWLSQTTLLADQDDMADIVRVVEKIRENQAELM